METEARAAAARLKLKRTTEVNFGSLVSEQPREADVDAQE